MRGGVSLQNLNSLNMKRFLSVIVLAAAVAVSAVAQPKALGMRVGWDGFSVNYQHYAGGANFLETDVALDYYYGDPGFKADAIYNFMIAQPNWTSRGDWGFYAGVGAQLGYCQHDFMLSFPVQVGLSYTFWFPLQLSFDIRPAFGFCAGKEHVTYYKAGLYGFVPSIGVHYAF